MGAYLSFPAIASYFILPSGSTTLTSLNLLFFYMTWSTLVMSHSPLKVEILGTLFAQITFFVLPSTVFLLLDLAMPNLVVNYKIQGSSGLTATTGARGRNGKPPILKVVGVSLGNMLLGLAVQAGIEHALTEMLQLRSVIRVDKSLPLPWKMAKEVLLGVTIREILYFYQHIRQHRSTTWISSYHKGWAHAIAAPYSFTAFYDHPVSHILLNVLALYLPSIMLRPHILSYLIMVSLTSLQCVVINSGYTWWPIIFDGMTRRRDEHMRNGGEGNYSTVGMLDRILGTWIEVDDSTVDGKWMKKRKPGPRRGVRRSTRKRA